MAEVLAVWLYGTQAAIVEQDQRRRLRLTYSADALERYPLGVPLLSLALPLRPERYPHGVTRAFLDGLLPEGESRRASALDVRVSSDDTFGLIAALGKDCAGALVIQPADEPAPPPPSALTAEPLTEAQVADLIANLRSAPLGISGRVRLSLAGVQEKLLLTRLPDGRWGRPVDGTPSTHILKPEVREYPHSVDNEALCMRVARHLGLAVADVATKTFATRRVLVVERFDRRVHADGTIQRIHQEDFCQATGTPPERKYEEDGGPSLRDVAGIVQTAVSKRRALDDLLRATLCNVAIGNGDAHAKNFSLLHHESGELELSPLYDLISTLPYGQDHLAMSIDSVQRIDRVTRERVINEAVRWGMDRQHAAEVANDFLDRMPGAVQQARDQTPDAPPDIVQLVQQQRARL
ncbi:MAG: HipA domain-containing protein [Candidatus Dormibacteraeota bacterium]|nr:HipA domain-containing protein [Candidatus Dormibacteraeota bacterium]